MSKNMFDLDDELLEDKKNYNDELKKARVLCIRGQYARALEIYNKILDEDFENEEALIGLLRVHSKDFREFDGDIIEDDIRVIEKIAPDTVNEEYLDYIVKRKEKDSNNEVMINDNKTQEKSNVSKNKLYKAERNKIYFGTYPQDINNTRLPIEWDILEENNGKVLIISHYILDAKRFDSESNDYGKSEIRKWLNNDFINAAFNNNEKSIIEEVEIKSLDSYNEYIYSNTFDKIFLLSPEDAKKYFKKSSARCSIGTEYAKSNGLWVNKETGNSRWWLSYYNFANFARCVAFNGDIGEMVIYGNDVGIRPALWINL